MSYWHMANAIVSLFAAATLTVIILHPRIHEGLLIKVGLMMVVLSLLGTAGLTVTASTYWDAYWRAGFALRAGMALVCLGVLYRARKLTREQDRPCSDHHRTMTRRWMYRITEPVYDLAHLFSTEPERRTEHQKEHP